MGELSDQERSGKRVQIYNAFVSVQFFLSFSPSKSHASVPSGLLNCPLNARVVCRKAFVIQGLMLGDKANLI